MNLSTLLATSLHTVTSVLWIGGIFLAYRVLRPAAMQLEPSERLSLWMSVFNRFFPWVWGFILVLVVSGYWDWMVRFGGFEAAPFYLHVMHLIGWVMIFLFAWLYFVPFARFKNLVLSYDFAAAGQVMNSKMRPIIALNLFLGVAEAVIGASGPFWS